MGAENSKFLEIDPAEIKKIKTKEEVTPFRTG